MQTRPPALPHRDPRRRASSRPTHRRRLKVLVALVCSGMVLLAACSTIRVFTDFSQVLRDAGFGNVTVTVEGQGTATLVVSATAPAGDTADEAHDRAGELVWQHFPRRFERARITIDGDRRVVTRTELEQAHGPRPAALDETDLTDEVTRFGVTALVVALVGGIVFVIAVTVTVVLVVRSNRRRQRQGGGPPPPGAIPAPWAPPGTTGHPPAWVPPDAHAHDPAPPTGPGSAPPGPVPPTGPGVPPPPPTGLGPYPTPGPMSPPPGQPSPPPGSTPPTPGGPLPTPGQAYPAGTAHEEDGPTRRRLGRRPRGPVPPESQIPPGWGG